MCQTRLLKGTRCIFRLKTQKVVVAPRGKRSSSTSTSPVNTGSIPCWSTSDPAPWKWPENISRKWPTCWGLWHPSGRDTDKTPDSSSLLQMPGEGTSRWEIPTQSTPNSDFPKKQKMFSLKTKEKKHSSNALYPSTYNNSLWPAKNTVLVHRGFCFWSWFLSPGSFYLLFCL